MADALDLRRTQIEGERFQPNIDTAMREYGRDVRVARDLPDLPCGEPCEAGTVGDEVVEEAEDLGPIVDVRVRAVELEQVDALNKEREQEAEDEGRPSPEERREWRVAALRLVQQGKLGLDQSLNEKLVSWKIPNNEFTRQKAPTLRHVLSHSAGFNVATFSFKTESSPMLLDVLKGKAENPAVQIESAPGTKYVESAGGYCVVQQLLVDVGGRPFPELMRELVLDPAGMNESTFDQPLPKDWEVDAAVGHFVDQQPLAWRWHNCNPALAASGLWCSPADLARWIIALSEAPGFEPWPELVSASPAAPRKER
jgi:hypothetical protein